MLIWITTSQGRPLSGTASYSTYTLTAKPFLNHMTALRLFLPDQHLWPLLGYWGSVSTGLVIFLLSEIQW